MNRYYVKPNEELQSDDEILDNGKWRNVFSDEIGEPYDPDWHGEKARTKIICKTCSGTGYYYDNIKLKSVKCNHDR